MPLIKGKSNQPNDETTGREAGQADIATAMSGGTVDERWAAVRAAANVPAGLDILRHALTTETVSRVREAIFTALARIGTPASAAVVAAYVGSDDPEMRTGALDALRAMPEATARHLPDLLRDSDPDVRLLACELVRNQPTEAANALLSSLLADEMQANVCAAAVEVLAETGDHAILPVLQGCAARFPDDPFLAFAIGLASDRIGSQASCRG
jgi:HEAT repeat protein